VDQASDVQNFIEEANRLTDLSALDRLLDATAKTFGFDYYALTHHVDFTLTKRNAVHLYNYPSSWVGTVIERGYFSDDPILAAAQRCAAGFLWSDISRIINLSARHKEILEAASQNGMGDGFTTPVHVPGEYFGSCSFGTRSGRALSVKAIPAAHYVSSFAFEAARRLTRQAESEDNSDLLKRPQLSQRQLDCIVLAAQGKSNGDIAQLLGISRETVHTHIEDAKRRYNVATRIQLITRTLFSSQLTFADIMGGASPG
jgi:LuxR family quorum-sensing system transcriptional regulator CciR